MYAQSYFLARSFIVTMTMMMMMMIIAAMIIRTPPPAIAGMDSCCGTEQ